MLILERLVGLHGTIQLQLLQCYGQGIDLDYSDIEWFALETIRDHSGFSQQDIKYPNLFSFFLVEKCSNFIQRFIVIWLKYLQKSGSF